MSDTLTIEGLLLSKGESQQVSERFKKREFVLDIAQTGADGKEYPNFAKMQLSQSKCELLDNFHQGQKIKVSFNIRGNKWEKDGKVNYITSLDAWRIELAQESAQSPTQPTQTESPKQSDDLPF